MAEDETLKLGVMYLVIFNNISQQMSLLQIFLLTHFFFCKKRVFYLEVGYGPLPVTVESVKV